MTFRARLMAAFLLVALVPLIALALIVHAQVTSRMTAQYERRVDAMASLVGDDLSEARDAVAASIDQVREQLAADNRFRRAMSASPGADDRRYVLDYAGDAMRLTGLSMLQIQDADGRILSSGQFRNDYDRLDPELPRLLASAPGRSALARVRTAGAPMVVLAAVDSVVVGKQTMTIVGGVDAKTRLLRRSPGDDVLSVALVIPGVTQEAAPSPGEAITRDLPVPYADVASGTLAPAAFRVSHRLDELRAVRRRIDRWFLIVVAAAACVAIVFAGWSASRISRPLAALAEKTARVDLERLDVDFESNRADEVGVLARGLGAMTSRLREGAALLRDAERRAVTGDLARQVNHDIKNGLTPIRNAFHHLVEESESRPDRVADVLRERRAALDSSIAYLEALAANYARLSRQGEKRRTDLSDVARRVVADRGASPVRIETDLRDGVTVIGDPLSLRRVVENLLDNAVDALDGHDGRVTIQTTAVQESDGPSARLSVSDTGAGMDAAQRARVFDDFYTTKAGGTGLGLSIVRRLVMDAGGSIRVESEPGKGSRFVVDIPLAAGPARGEDG